MNPTSFSINVRSSYKWSIDGDFSKSYLDYQFRIYTPGYQLTKRLMIARNDTSTGFLLKRYLDDEFFYLNE